MQLNNGSSYTNIIEILAKYLTDPITEVISRDNDRIFSLIKKGNGFTIKKYT